MIGIGMVVREGVIVIEGLVVVVMGLLVVVVGVALLGSGVGGIVVVMVMVVID